MLNPSSFWPYQQSSFADVSPSKHAIARMHALFDGVRARGGTAVMAHDEIVVNGPTAALEFARDHLLTYAQNDAPDTLLLSKTAYDLLKDKMTRGNVLHAALAVTDGPEFTATDLAMLEPEPGVIVLVRARPQACRLVVHDLGPVPRRAAGALRGRPRAGAAGDRRARRPSPRARRAAGRDLRSELDVLKRMYEKAGWEVGTHVPEPHYPTRDDPVSITLTLPPADAFEGE